MNAVTQRLVELFSVTRIARYTVDHLLPNLILGIVTFGAFYLAWMLVRRGLRLLARTGLDETARAFIGQLAKYSILTVGVISALGQMGVNTASMLASLGVAGLTIGFAARDTLSNVISGLFIFWDRPFVVGDLIEIGGHYGRVDEITLRSTRVVTVDGRMLAIPNSSIVNSTVASYTNFPNLRLEIDFTVAVTEDLDRVRELLLDMVEGDERFLAKPAPDVVVTALNDYNVAMRLRIWLEEERDHVSVRFELRKACFECLRAAEVDMPYETLAMTPLTIRGLPPIDDAA